MFSLIESAGGVIPAEAVGGWTTPVLEHLEASASEATYRSYEDEQLRKLFAACGLSRDIQFELGPSVMELRELENITVFPDVVELLDELKARGHSRAVLQLELGPCSTPRAQRDHPLLRHRDLLCDRRLPEAAPEHLYGPARRTREPAPATRALADCIRRRRLGRRR